MSVGDTSRAKRIEALLVRHYLDTSKLDVEVIGSTAYISGELHMFEYDLGQRRLKEPGELAPAVNRTCQLIDQEILRLMDVWLVKWDLRNWEKRTNHWVQREASLS